MIDAQLAESVPESADIEAQRLFDADLSLSNIARFADALAERCADARSARPGALRCIEAVLSGDEDAVDRRAAILRQRQSGPTTTAMTVVAHRLADRDAELHDRPAPTRGRDRTPSATPSRRSSRRRSTLNAGWLPGSGPVSTEASTTPGRGGVLDRTALPPYVRATIQVAVAATIAIVVGDMVSGQRLYWAVLATFLAFIATTNSGEQVRKALFRVGGTAIGIVIGDLLVHVTGGHIWSSLLIVHGRPVLRHLPDPRQLHLHGHRHHGHAVPAVRAARRVQLAPAAAAARARPRSASAPSCSPCCWSCRCARNAC